MPPRRLHAGTGRWTVRRTGRRWNVYDRHGGWQMETSYWWLAMWAVTRDRRHIPPGQEWLAHLVG